MRTAIVLSVLLPALCAFSGAAEEQAVVENVSGAPHALRAFRKVPLAKGGELRAGDIVTTGEGASVQVRLPGGDLVEVGQRSSVKASSWQKIEGAGGRKTMVELLDGTGSFTAHKLAPQEEFIVKTPVAVVGVRGTKFLVMHHYSRRHGAVSSVAVVSGAVQVQSARFAGLPGCAPVTVGAMQKSEVPADAPPAPPQPITRAELQAIQAAAGIPSAPEDGAAAPPEGAKATIVKDVLAEVKAQAVSEAQAAVQSAAVERVQQQVSEQLQEAVQSQQLILRRPVAPPATP